MHAAVNGRSVAELTAPFEHRHRNVRRFAETQFMTFWQTLHDTISIVGGPLWAHQPLVTTKPTRGQNLSDQPAGPDAV